MPAENLVGIRSFLLQKARPVSGDEWEVLRVWCRLSSRGSGTLAGVREAHELQGFPPEASILALALARGAERRAAQPLTLATGAAVH